MKKTSTLALLSFLFHNLLFSQGIIPPKTWEDIEGDIAARRNLVGNQKILTDWKENSMRKNDEASFLRTMYDLMLIADRRTEDTLYWKNAVYLDSIIADKTASDQIRSAACLLKARRILGYRSQFHNRNNKNLIANYHPVYKYNLMMASSLDSLTIFHFEKAISFSQSSKNKDAVKYLWLSFDPLQFLFRPDFTDIIFAEETHFLELINQKKTITKVPDWMKSDPEQFFQPQTAWKEFTLQEQKIYSAYRQWANYHAAEPFVYFFIETMARKCLYNGIYQHEEFQEEYAIYLQKLSSSPFTAARANGIYQLCLLWNRQAKSYNPVSKDYNNYHYRSIKTGFDTTYRYYYVKALQLFESNEKTLDSFPFMKGILLKMRNAIKKSTLSLSSKTYLLPGEPQLLFLQFRNIKQVHYRLVRINHSNNYSGIRTEDFIYYLKSPALKDSVITIPAEHDYQLHNSYLKLGSLNPGRYLLIYSDSAIATTNTYLRHLILNVTDIAVINNNEQVYILSRKTGFPVENASAVEYRIQTNNSSIYDTIVSKPQRIAADGSLITKSSARQILVTTAIDTFFTALNQSGTGQPYEIYNKDEYDDLNEYYEDNIRLHIFTDRAIYRPGQTVFYKGIFLTNNPYTGEQVVLNWKNLQFSFFRKLFYKALVKFSKQKIELSIDDPFGREMDSLKILPNKYGSFTGAFKIPKDAATGEWEISSLDFDNADENSGTFMVEEYKRPGFSLSLEKPTTEKTLGDSFSVKVKVKSFAGLALNNIPVKYQVSVTGSARIFENGKWTYRNRNETLIDSEAYTDDKGELLIPVIDSLIKRTDSSDEDDQVQYYTINAEAIDATGESHEEEVQISLSTKPVQISASIPRTIERNNFGPIRISTNSDPGGALKKLVTIKLYRNQAKQYRSLDQWPDTDVMLYSRGELESGFPDYFSDSRETADTEKLLLYETSLHTGGTELLSIPVEILTTGNYSIEINSIDNGKITGEFNRSFSVYDQKAGTIPDLAQDLTYLPFNYTETGKELTWITGTKKSRIYCLYHLAYFVKLKSGIKLINTYNLRIENQGLNEWKFKLPHNAVSTAKINRIYIFNGDLSISEQDIYINQTSNSDPEIVVEHYRQKMLPGATENFTVTIRTNDVNTAAELMTTMYDASLDKLAEHKWVKPHVRNYFYVRTNWQRVLNSNNSNYAWYDPEDLNISLSAQKLRIWWMDSSISSGFLNSGDDDFQSVSSGLQGKAAGVQVLQTSGLDEVVVVGYGTKRLQSLTTSSVVQIRGAASLSGYSSMLIIMDGNIYTGDIKNINQNLITDAAILKGADATAIYGSQGSNGVLILSTQGPITSLPAPPEPPLVIRKNFSETAFFFPKIYAGRNGIYNIQFTLPESVTEWKWKMLAHTRSARFVYAEKTLVSQNQLMVQPDMPRFLYQGDQIVLKSRISNLDTAIAKGKLVCTIEDLVTGEDLSSAIISNNQQTVSVLPSSNGYGNFLLKIPDNLLHPMRVRVSVRSKSFADGEEYTIPILSRKMMFSIQVPVNLGTEQSKKIIAPELPAGSDAFGVAIGIALKPQASLINALPWLANYRYNCAEQTFNKILAHATAIGISRKEPLLINRFESTPPLRLPYELSEQTMPWLQLATKTELQNQQLKNLFDTLRGYEKIENYFKDISSQQNSDGGISWFKGGNSDWFISNYLMGGFARLKNEHPYVFKTLNKNGELLRFIDKLADYTDRHPYDSNAKQSLLTYLNARDGWVADYPIADSIKRRIDLDLQALWNNAQNLPIAKQAMLVTATIKYYPTTNSLHKKATGLLESIRQLAIADTVNGIRWKDMADADDLSSTTEDWVMRIAEAFETAGHSEETIRGIIQWLLTAKKEHHWSSTKSTAEIIGLIGRHQKEIIGETKEIRVKMGTTEITVTDDLFSGNYYAFKPSNADNFPDEIMAEKKSPTPVSGSMVFYYFTADPPSGIENNAVKLSKSVLIQNPVSKQWEQIKESQKIKIADKIKIILSIEAPKQLSYVFIDDKRAACLEPVDGMSGYGYENHLSYYKSVRDEGFQFFFEKIPSGISNIQYELVAAKEGIFTNGISALQCMYQPELSAYSKGLKLEVIR